MVLFCSSRCAVLLAAISVTQPGTPFIGGDHLANDDAPLSRNSSGSHVYAVSELDPDRSLHVDLGEVVRDTMAPLSITILNDTKSATALTAVRSGCGCTRINSWPRVLQQGAAGSIDGDFHAPHRAGIAKGVGLTIVRDRTVVGVFTITATIVDPLLLDVSVKDRELVVSLSARDQEPFAVTGFEPSALKPPNHGPAARIAHTYALTAESWRRAGAPRRFAILTGRDDEPAVVVALSGEQVEGLKRAAPGESVASPDTNLHLLPDVQEISR